MSRALRPRLLLLATLAASTPHSAAWATPPRNAEPSPASHPPLVPTAEDPSDLRGRFGVDKARALLRAEDAGDRLRGIERAAAIGTREAIGLLVEQLDLASTTRSDARARIAIARGLALHTDQLAARAALIQLLDLATPRASAQKPETEDPLYAPRLELARAIAALALARSGEGHAVEALVNVARGASAGTRAATAALVAYPPSSSAVWAKPMSAPIARLVAATGDLRALGAVLEAAQDTSPADAFERAAAIEALGALGDARVIEIAKGSLADDDPRVRAAATSALVAMGAPEAARAVEELLGNDATAGRGIELALLAHAPGVVHALAARAAIAADLGVREAAVAAIGRDPTADGTEALLALMRDPLLRADAADALGRSPSPAAMGAIAHLAATAATRRLATKAYVVRARTRGERSAEMERVIAELARPSQAPDEGNRATGIFAQIALGQTEARRWIDDADPLVRRAAAMATLARPGAVPSRGGDARTDGPLAALLTQRGREEDAPTRAVLGIGLLDGDTAGRVPTRALLACARGGGGDVPLCALAFARRASAAESEEIDALFASPDPIVRAHAARGLAGSDDPTRAGRLAAAYAYEPDPIVRRAITVALAGAPREAPSVAETLAFAADFDPDPETRWTAARLVASRPPPGGAEGEIAWIHLADANGAPPPAGANAATGALLRADGLAVPIVFDADGDALVPGVPPGSARLFLAPRLDAAYEGRRGNQTSETAR